MVQIAHIARDEGDLTLNVSDIVTVTEQGDDGWWKGRLNDKEGLFPSHCVQLLKSRQPTEVCL